MYLFNFQVIYQGKQKIKVLLKNSIKKLIFANTPRPKPITYKNNLANKNLKK